MNNTSVDTTHAYDIRHPMELKKYAHREKKSTSLSSKKTVLITFLNMIKITSMMLGLVCILFCVRAAFENSRTKQSKHNFSPKRIKQMHMLPTSLLPPYTVFVQLYAEG